MPNYQDTYRLALDVYRFYNDNSYASTELLTELSDLISRFVNMDQLMAESRIRKGTTEETEFKEILRIATCETLVKILKTRIFTGLMINAGLVYRKTWLYIEVIPYSDTWRIFRYSTDLEGNEPSEVWHSDLSPTIEDPCRLYGETIDKNKEHNLYLVGRYRPYAKPTFMFIGGTEIKISNCSPLTSLSAELAAIVGNGSVIEMANWIVDIFGYILKTDRYYMGHVHAVLFADLIEDHHTGMYAKVAAKFLRLLQEHYEM